MTLYIDMHDALPAGATIDDVRAAHARDLEVQGAYGVQYQRYWMDEATGTVFCLVDAPDEATAERVHREAHGLVADRLFPVVEGT
jgi:hypothetical protein